MTALALLLVLVAAVLHAVWNYCAKRAGGGLPFVWVVGLVICAAYVPVTGFYCWRYAPSVGGGALLWILGSGVLKTGYSLFLQRGYRTGDFSLIYPLARGTGPLLSTLAAVLLLGERPSALACAGGAVIVACIFWLTGGLARVVALVRGDRPAPVGSGPAVAGPVYSSVNYGVISGVFIAAYTIWDRQGVAALAIAPILYDAGTSLTSTLLLAPFAWRRRPEVAREWREHRRWVLGVALLSPTAYVLVLTAMRFTPVSFVAPAREISIVVGAFIGARVLREANPRRRLLAAAGMAVGVIALALG
ncbi:EamA family transporter [Opitutus sp. ER46]|uniref:EamA family transporter n=1 Tax=Opitutus sp. ER46 TaxID=2161864 RepID=UPI000D318904|nr:EamA family transporter [Opitutus sp. ER46]PTX96610.1 EamA family transporter [Opitutus sp. ER46]